MAEHPAITLEKAIITRLTGDDRWVWPIYGYDVDVGQKYLLLENVTSTDISAKIGQTVEYFFSFDAHETALSSRGVKLSHATVYNMLWTMERIITVMTDGAKNFNRLDCGPNIKVIAHQVETPLQILPVAPEEAHAREIIRFKVCQ